MSKSKNIVSLMLILVLAMALAPMIPTALGGATVTPTPAVPAGFGPPYNPANYWYYDTTLLVWVAIPWGAACPTTGGNVLVKFPTVIQATPTGQASPQGPWWKQDSLTPGPGVTILGGPWAQGAGAGVPVPTYRYMLGDDPGDVTVHYGRGGPRTDLFRALVVKSPDAQLLAMKEEDGHVLDGMIRPGDIEDLDARGFTVTSTPGFHMGHIGYNIRSDQSYKTLSNPDAAFVLSDVNFRHACFHCYNQLEIVPSIYGYVVTPVQSMVPPAQKGWMNEEVPLHPYDPGSPTATTIYDPVTHENEDACSILRYGGYMYDGAEWVTPYDIDGDLTPGTDGSPGTPATEITDADDVVPDMEIWTPTYEVAPTSAEHGTRFVTGLHSIGLTSITAVGRTFSEYTSDVFDLGDFDMYMVFWELGRFPDHLYTMCHSDHDVVKVPGDYNAPGCHDADLDDAVFTIISSLDHDEKMEACYKAQNILYNETYPDAAFSYMQLYSRILFDSWNPEIKGIVNSPGYGTKNGWTDLNMHWYPGYERLEDYHGTGEMKTIIVWIWGEEPELLNPCSADTVYAWDIIDRTLDGLMGVNPYTHEDIPWMAEDWEIQKWATEDDVSELLTGMVPVTNESLGMGDGETTVFNLENCHVVSGSETVYLNRSAPTEVTLVKDTDYTIDYTAGEITFTTAPSETTWINVDYTYNYMLGADCVGSHWHEDWPTWSTNWHMTSWTDDDASDTLTIGDQVDFDDGPEYEIVDMTWDIKVENLSEPYNEMKLSGTDIGLARPPTEITAASMVGTDWHEEWPTRSTTWTVTGFTDNGDGILSRSDTIQLDGTDFHVDSVTVTLHLDKKPVDATIDKVIEFAGTGMKVLFWLRTDVFWQDGNPYVADDAVFNWLFLRDNRIPRYKGMWQFLEDAVAVTDYKVVAYMNITSQFLIYDLAGLAAMLPPPVWSPLDGQPLNVIMEYDPANDHTPPTGAGPWFGAGQGFPDTCLYGTGIWVFEYYDKLNFVGDLHQFVGYFKLQSEIQEQKAEMFYNVGDITRDGYIDVFDLSSVGVGYGKRNITDGSAIPQFGDGSNMIFRVPWKPVVPGSETVYLDGISQTNITDYTMDYASGVIVFNTAPGSGVKVTADYCQVGYNLETDLTKDNVIDARDLALVTFNWGDQKEYPEP